MHIIKPVVLSVIVVLNVNINLAQAQPPMTMIHKQIVTPRALITQVEIAEYRYAIKSAPTHEARMAIREATYSKLRQRATERGMIMSEPQPWYGGLHWGELIPQQTKQKQIIPETKPVLPQPQVVPVLPHPITPLLNHPIKPAQPRAM